ncbi:(d)CMP kinase [Nonomuraea sp. MCN248]|uniref:(D)CMP kinase n=1 Tax=Nonomuraea corallina TaxID=2989783 RepID=A0ABT4S6J2_9ACTN|nr:(d)CMP kinase [Nonomuraea corallina]MDA0632630.1 (d)CMP kinase [Nonomuraea corallina]
MRRISVVGNSGSGKSTIAAELARRLGVPWLELDSIYHMPGWTPRPVEEFRAEVDAFTSGDGWVVDGNYSAVRDLVWARSDTVVWVDPPKATVMRRLSLRTLCRMATGAELWNGNRERFGSLFTKDESILRWAWDNHRKYRDRYAKAAVDPAYAHLRFVRVTSRDDLARVLDG